MAMLQSPRQCALLAAIIVGALSVLFVLEWTLRLPLDIDAPTSAAGVSYGRSVGTLARSSLTFAPLSVEWQTQRQRELDLKFTIRVNTFRRNHLLKQVVEHYHTCPRVHDIHVIWSDLENPPPPKTFFHLQTTKSQKASSVAFPVLGVTPKLQMELHSVDSLNNRFRPILDVETEAVFSVDDDLIIPCSLLDFTHEVWRAAPMSMVGYMPRMHGFDEVKRRFTYHEWWYVWRHGLYSMILTKACFLHRTLLSAYAGTVPAPTVTDTCTSPPVRPNHPHRPTDFTASGMAAVSGPASFGGSGGGSGNSTYALMGKARRTWSAAKMKEQTNLRHSRQSRDVTSRISASRPRQNGDGSARRQRALLNNSTAAAKSGSRGWPAMAKATPLPPADHLMATIHSYIDERTNCEDIAMAFVAANFTRRPPVWVRGYGVREIGSSGLSSNQKAHFQERSDCIHDFVDLFAGVPLVHATSKVDRASNFLFWR